MVRRYSPSHDHHLSGLADLPDQIARTLGDAPTQDLVPVFLVIQITWYFKS
jgi:hypothetical protein